ncbi:MAG: BatD family protein, partial [Planctomycetes bacterium]|nr:BatD family protein [Planctomycetota bacterium]
TGRIEQAVIVKHHFQLTPRREGELKVPAPKLVVGGETLVGRPLTLTVRGAERQDLVILELGTDRERLYRQQPFSLRLDCYVRALPAPYEDRDPLSVQGEGSEPRMNIPWVDLPPGLESVEGRQWLERYFDRSGNGFTINQDPQRSFGIFSMNVPTFRPPPQRTRRAGLDGTTRDYWHYAMVRAFTPVKAGIYTFGAVSLKGQFCTSVREAVDRFGRERLQLEGTDIYAVSNPVVVTVLEPPAEGRPPSYTGGVGSFRVWATAAPQKLRVGDPLTVTIHVEGERGLGDVGPLRLADQAEIAARFRVYEDAPTGEIKGTRKTFVHSMRPLSAEVTEVPPIALSFFDPEAEIYRTVRTDPVPLEVVVAEKLDPGAVVMGRTAAGTTDLTERREGLFASVTDVGSLGNERVRPVLWFGLLGGLLGLYVVLALVAGFVRRRYSDPVLVRRRAAFPRATQRLRQARRLAEPAGVLEGVHAAFREAVGAVRNVPAEGLTAHDVAALARDLGDEALGDRIQTLLERCEAARFGAAAPAADQARAVAEEARLLLDALARLQRHAGRGHGRRLGLLLAGAALALGTAGRGVAAQDAEVARLFLRAAEREERAQSAEDYLAAAALYREILERDGYRNGALLYNLGNAYCRAGQLGRAIAAYREARRYRPGDDYLDANLRQALARRVDQFPEPGRSLVDHILFWTHTVPYPLQFRLLLGAGLLAFLLALLRLFRPGMRGTRATLGAAVALTLLLGAGAALSAYRYEAITNGVLVQPETAVLKAPRGEPAYDKPLHEGTEFIVAETRESGAGGGWYRIRFAGDREGWIPAEAAVTY